MNGSKLEDPNEKYPKPPYRKQSQPWPGLASNMDPPPDHGEKSYRGSGRLAGRKAPITGGDFGMGRAAAIAYAREGADVAINYLPSEEPDAQRGDRADQGGRPQGRCHPGRPPRGIVLPEAGGRRGAESSAGSTSSSAMPGGSKRVHSILDVSQRGFRRDDENQHLRAVLDHQGGAAAPASRARAIIGTASEQAYDPSPDLFDYAQTKAATMNYSRRGRQTARRAFAACACARSRRRPAPR